MAQKKLCVIFAGGPEQGIPCLPVPQNAYYICADSGLRLAAALRITPDLVLGDFDSLGYVPEGFACEVLPAEKDDTDTVYAVRTALRKGFRDIRIYGAFGGRLDHTFANLQTLEFLHSFGAAGMLIGTHDFAMLTEAGTQTLRHMEGFSLSLFAWSESCKGVSIRGVKYPLEQGELMRHYPLGCSNEITADNAEIIVDEGILLMMGSRLIRSENMQEYFAYDAGTRFPPSKECSVHGESDYRLLEAQKQAKKEPVPVERIIALVNEFLSAMGMRRAESPVRSVPVNYAGLKQQYGLCSEKDMVWMKFTTDGYLGVVAVSDDINFDMPQSEAEYHMRNAQGWVHNTSGILMHQLGKTWDTSFVLVFPLAPIPEGKTRGDLERAIGNYLIAKGVPILDYYSHNY